MTDVTLSEGVVYALGQLRAATVRSAEEVVLVLGQARADNVKAYQTPVQALEATKVNEKNIRIGEAVVYALVKADRDDRRMRAWTFSQNGHNFYVLKLGQQGTIVWDTVAKRWAEWGSLGDIGWRAVAGLNWESDIVAGDRHIGMVWDILEGPVDDNNVAIQTVVTGGIPARLRAAMPCNGVMLTGSVGSIDSPNPVAVTLRTSDDDGHTWLSHGALTAQGGDYGVQLIWYSLGQITAPGRLFEVIDTGVVTRIDSLDMW